MCAETEEKASPADLHKTLLKLQIWWCSVKSLKERKRRSFAKAGKHPFPGAAAKRHSNPAALLAAAMSEGFMAQNTVMNIQAHAAENAVVTRKLQRGRPWKLHL